MAKQFSKRRARVETETAMSSFRLDESVSQLPDSQQIHDWLSRLSLLYGVPFNYLVPDIRMLPEESLRFFQVDENWLLALLNGAFNPGTTASTSAISSALSPQVQQQVSERLAEVRATILNEKPVGKRLGSRSGFFLRSAVVSGWPGMEITGYADAAATTELTILRLERLSPSLLFCVFDGNVACVKFSQPAEAIHFTFDPARVQVEGLESIIDDTYYKSIRYVNSYNGVEAGSYKAGAAYPVDVNTNGVVNIDSLAGAMSVNAWAPGTPQQDQVFTSAEFGLAMVQDTDEVNFTLNS